MDKLQQDDFYGIPGVTFDDARELLVYKGQTIDPDAFFDDLEATYLSKYPRDKELRDFEDWCQFNPDAVKKMLDSYVTPIGETKFTRGNIKMKRLPKTKLERVSESRKLVKEGAGAGYTVHIKGLKTGKILNMQKKGEDPSDEYYEVEVEVVPCEVEVGAEDYYNDFFWQEHEWGDTPTAQVDGGVINVVFTWYKDEDEIRQEIENTELDFDFDYGGGWSHSDLPRDKPIDSDRIKTKTDNYYEIFEISLNAPDLADAVNCGYQSIYDRDEEEEENLDDENEEYDESIEDNEEDDSAGYGQWHVFDFGPDFDFYERYTVIAPDGYVFFIGSDGGVGSFEDERMSYSTSDEMCDILATKDRKGNEVVPSELELSPDGISHDRIVSKGLTRIKDKYDYIDEV